MKNGRGAIIEFAYGGDTKDPMLATSTKFVDVAKQDDLDTV